MGIVGAHRCAPNPSQLQFNRPHCNAIHWVGAQRCAPTFLSVLIPLLFRMECGYDGQMNSKIAF